MTELEGIYDVDIMENGSLTKDGYSGVFVLLDGPVITMRADSGRVYVHVLKPGQHAEITPVS